MTRTIRPPPTTNTAAATPSPDPRPGTQPRPAAAPTRTPVASDGDAAYIAPPPPPIGSNPTRVSTAEGLDVRGSALVTPQLTTWDKVCDLLIEILTLSIVDTAWFNDKIDDEHWHDSAATIAMAGGPSLRAHIATASSAEAQAKLREAVRRANPGASDTKVQRVAGALHRELAALYRQPGLTDDRLAGLQAALAVAPSETFPATPGAWLHERLAAYDPLASRPTRFAQIDEVAALARHEGLNALAAEHQGLAVAAMVRGGAGPALRQAITRLAADYEVTRLDSAARTTVFTQLRHHPSAGVADNLRGMAQTFWFQTMEHHDRQRAAKVIAHLSAQRFETPRQQALVDDTLGRFLTMEGYWLAFRVYADPPGRMTYGTAHGTTFGINHMLVWPDDEPLDDTFASDVDALVHAMAHEVNHIVNADHTKTGFDRFMAEYRAWYVGMIAQTGTPPSRQTAYHRARYLVTNPGYASIGEAFRTNAGGAPGADAQAMLRFMQRFTHRDLDPTRSQSRERALGATVSRPSDEAPAPDPAGNLTNVP